MTCAVRPLLRFLAILAAVAIGGSWLLQSVDQAAAQAVSKPQPVDGRKTVISGIKSYEAGRMDKAVATLTKAISGGGLSTQDLAKALYYRGLAHQRSNQSAQAIADLTSAVWMKGGLSPSEQQAALAARSKAYAAVGVSDPGPPAQSIGKPSPAAPPSRVAPAPAQTNQVAAVAKPTPPVAAKPTPTAATKPTSVAAAPQSSGFQTQVKRSNDSPASANSEPAATASSPLSGVGSFFSNIFGGGSSASAPQPTASAPVQPPVAAAPVASTPVVASPTVRAPAQPAPRVAKVETPAAVLAPAPVAPVKPKKPVISAPPVHAPFETTLSRAPSPPPVAPPASAPPRAAPPRAAPPRAAPAPRVTAPAPAAPPSVAPATPRTVAAAPSEDSRARYEPSKKGVSLSALDQLSETNNNVGSFFSNLFGGGEQSSTASKQAPAGGSSTAVSAWNSDQSGAGSRPMPR